MRSGLALLLVIALAGCDRLFNVVSGQSDGGRDDHGDANPLEPDGPPGCITIGMNGTGQGELGVAGFYKRCLLDTTRNVSISGTFSTSGVSCDSDTIDNTVCAIVAHEIDVQGIVTVNGPLPLVLVATGVINVSGTLDLSSSPNGTGAGANWTACDTLALAGGADGEGGAGGTLDSSYPGGDGGASQSAGPATVLTKTPYASLHGGCQGGTASSGTSPTDSGGAVYLMAPVITISGAIVANGADGAGGATPDGGGFGGGSGGMIALDAATIAFSRGMLHARGGGGGGGGSVNGGGVMGNGGVGGSPGGNAGGFGGNGYAMPNQATDGGAGASSEGLPAGGGGGGGGAGGILLFTASPVVGGAFDPAAIQ